jgi:hypothetical protein
VAIRSTDAKNTDRAKKNRSGQLEAEEVNGEVARGAIHQHARNKPPMVKRVRILSLRELVAAAPLNVR